MSQLTRLKSSNSVTFLPFLKEIIKLIPLFISREDFAQNGKLLQKSPQKYIVSPDDLNSPSNFLDVLASRNRQYEPGSVQASGFFELSGK